MTSCIRLKSRERVVAVCLNERLNERRKAGVEKVLHTIKKIKTMLSDKTYFKRIFFVISSGFVFSMIVVFFSVFFLSRNILVSSEKDSTYSEADNFASWNDVRISTAKSILDTLISDDDVIKYAITGDHVYTMAISDRLNAYGSVLSGYYVNIGIVDLNRQSSIALMGVNKIDLSAITLPGNLDTVHYAPSTDKSLCLLNGHEYKGKSFYKKRIYADGNELLFFYTLYDNSRFDVRRTDKADDCYGVLYTDNLIYLSNKGYNGKAVEALAGKGNGFGEHGRFISYKLISREDPGFSYFYCTKTPGFAGFYIVIVILALLLLCLSFAIALVAASRLYSPINDIVVKFKRFNNENAEEGDIPYVLSSMEDMFDNITQFTQENRKNQDIIMNKFFADLLSGNVSDDNNYVEKFIKENRLEVLFKKHTPVAFLVANSMDISETYGSEGMSYIKKDIIEILEESLGEFYIYHDCYEGFVAFIPGNAVRYESIFENLSDVLETDFNIIVKVFIGNTIQDYSSEMAAYNAILLQRDEAFLYNSDKAVFRVGDQPKNTNVIAYSIEMERRLIDYILNDKRAAAEQTITTVIENNITQDVTISTIHQLRSSFKVTIMRILTYVGNSIDEVYGDGDILKFTTNGRSLDDIKQCLFDMFVPLLESMPKEDDTKTVHDKEKIRIFIDEQIKNNIGLDDLAQYLNYSSWYTSKIFKNLFNQNFRSYVNMRRVEIAKSLLENGCKVSEAAAAVGCAHIETFIRIFKKSTGILPSEYARRF